ncbi:FecR domain-containing protein [Herbaspirillum sp. LeCh32-8]|uniref:FecR domain-containing protein n=1 Tax=Herbaspirillum sp. LeCh32-8 TaxID=2821356 RepID=UPI001AE75385|nr:FecR domain-containing protein [Herbaspirillum sp. LeCh32-8]MBP0599795.1 FecR domain-containing protein [Herbaspirillum sp. LeCh32-8]
MSAPGNAGSPRLPETVIDAAIVWGVKLNYGEPTPETRNRFQHWLAADPLHLLAWERIGSFKPAAGSLQPALGRDVLAAAERARRQQGHERRRTLKVLSIGGLAVLFGWHLRDELGWLRLSADSVTAVGEQRRLLLADGTAIMLNTDSAVSTDFSGERRVVILRRGEIMVTTGADGDSAARRPFWVFTPFGKMQALGTRFVVRLEPQRARISVQEGAVELHPSAGGASLVIHPGQSAWLADDGAQAAAAQGFAADGFAEGVIAGQDIRLDALLDELARYRRGIISCDAAVAGLRVSGVFHVDDTDRALQFLLQTQPLSVTYRTRLWVVVGPARPG